MDGAKAGWKNEETDMGILLSHKINKHLLWNLQVCETFTFKSLGQFVMLLIICNKMFTITKSKNVLTKKSLYSSISTSVTSSVAL